jgi:hypothetical protein
MKDAFSGLSAKINYLSVKLQTQWAYKLEKQKDWGNFERGKLRLFKNTADGYLLLNC